ncbi:MAG: serine/threonine protein kinase, partial [Mycobacterium sp.]
DDREQACRRAAELLGGIDDERRPLAALTARLLLVETLMATGRVDDANAMLPGVTARCWELGLPRLLVDAGLG